MHTDGCVTLFNTIAEFSNLKESMTTQSLDHWREGCKGGNSLAVNASSLVGQGCGYSRPAYTLEPSSGQA